MLRAGSSLSGSTPVVEETDSGAAKADEVAWMRATLDTVGKLDWTHDGQGRPIYPVGFEALAEKLGRPLHPPGRDIRCIVSVGMLTEGWDCNTVTHIVGLRPFMSQLLCEQVPVLEKSRKAGSTGDVFFWTSRDVREVVKSHVNLVVADTAQWEQSAAYAIDSHPSVVAFVKNAGLGFAIPYLANGEPHDYEPDFIIRVAGRENEFLILETKGFDDRAEIKSQAAQRWAAAVNAAKTFGHWRFEMARSLGQVRTILDAARSR